MEGINPSLVMLEQLKEVQDDNYFSRYHFIVTGTDGPNRTRAIVEKKYLTPAEQVLFDFHLKIFNA